MKKIILLCVSFLLCATSVHASEVDRYGNSGYRSDNAPTQTVETTIGDTYEVMSENDELALYVDKETLGIKIKNKENNYVWSSVLETEDETLNKTWYGFAGSGVSIEYMSKAGKSEKASITNARAKVKVKAIQDGFHADINFAKQGVSFGINVTLSHGNLLVEMPKESLKETSEENLLQAIYLFPFLGYTKEQSTGGYMFVPDGSGALIRLDEKNTMATSPYQARYYGEDYGVSGTVDSVEAVSELQQLHIPVFGMVHNVYENGFVGIIEEGDEYAQLLATPAGITTDYNWISAKYIIRDPYFRLLNKKGDGYPSVQEVPNSFSIRMQYQFLDGERADYVGMAKNYQEHLVKQDILTKEKAKEEIPMHVEFLMSERKKTLFSTKAVAMTSVDDVEAILEDLKQQHITNLDVTLRGYSKQGSEKATLAHTSFESKVSSESEIKKLAKKLADEGNCLSLYTDYMRYYQASGYKEGKDSAQSLSHQLLQFRNHEDTYVAPTTIHSYFQDEMEPFKDMGLGAIASNTLGSTLYSNHNEKNLSTRNEAKVQYQQMLESASVPTHLYAPNAYLWKFSDTMYEIAMDSSKYVLFSDDVPFLQIVLKGYKDYYAQPLNFSSNTQKELLQMVDYGAYPSYILTKEDSKELRGTDSEWLYSSTYDSLKDIVKENYEFIKEGLLASEGKGIVSRRVIEDDVVKVVYDDHTIIYINYSKQDKQIDDVLVPAYDYNVVKGE